MNCAASDMSQSVWVDCRQDHSERGHGLIARHEEYAVFPPVNAFRPRMGGPGLGAPGGCYAALRLGMSLISSSSSSRRRMSSGGGAHMGRRCSLFSSRPRRFIIYLSGMGFVSQNMA